VEDAAPQQVVHGGAKLRGGQIEFMGETGEPRPSIGREVGIFEDEGSGPFQEQLDLSLLGGLQRARRWFGSGHSIRRWSSPNLPRQAAGPRSG